METPSQPPPPPPSQQQAMPLYKSYPKKLSKEELGKVLQAIEKLKSAGVDANDPKLRTLMHILKAQSFYYHFPQARSPNAFPTATPVSSPGPLATIPPSPLSPNSNNIPPSPSPSQPPVPAPQTAPQANGSGNHTKPSVHIRFPGGMTLHPNQLLQLKAQILAYKYLSRNLPLPLRLLSALRGFSMQRAPSIHQGVPQTIPIHRLPTTGTHPPRLPPGATANGPASVSTGGRPLQAPGPQNSSGPKSATPTPVMNGTGVYPNIPSPGTATPRPATASPVQQAPPGKPDPLPTTFLIQEREKRIAARMAVRLQALSTLPDDLSPELHRRSIIEQKKLKLFERQKRLRADILMRMRKLTQVDSAIVDSSVYKKPMRKSTKLPMAVPLPSALPKEVNAEKHREFLRSVLKHQENFRQHHANVGKLKKKLAKEIMQKRQAEEERKQRTRIEELRRGNVDAYRSFLDEEKHKRLTLLLDLTNQFMEKIGEMVKNQKQKDEMEEKRRTEKTKRKNKKVIGEGEEGEEKEGEGEAEGQEEAQGMEVESTETNPETAEAANAMEIVPPSSDKSSETISEKNKRYYATAHTIEEATEQPKMLVGGNLKSYQLTGLQWLVSLYNNKLNGILADEMGLGKTIQTISLIGYLMEKKGDNGPYLVVAPLSTISNWAMEFAKWAPSINVVIYKGKPPVRKQIFKTEIVDCTFNVCLTSYEFVMIDKSDLGKIEWNYIIIDEGHRIKNKNGKLSGILRKYTSRHRLLLTGTPLQNDLNELWALLNFLLPTIFNSSKDFAGWFNAPFEYASKKTKKDNSDYIAPNEEEKLIIIHTLHKVLRPFLLRRLKKEVEHDLPDKVESVLKCELSALQKRLYKNMVEDGVMLLDPDCQSSTKPKRQAKGFNNTLMQLQKICNHPYLFHEEYDIDRDLVRASGKFDLLDRILPKLRKCGHRILIFNQMTHIMDILEEYFRMVGYDFLRLDGSTKAEDRAQLVKVWNAPDSEYWLFILSTKAGGLGLNLQTADTVILFDTDWNPHMDLQAQDRVHRIGQEKEVRVFRLITHNTIEEKILEKAAFKKDVDAKVIQAGMFNTTANDKMRRELLQKLLEEEDDNEETSLIVSDEQVNTIISRSDEEFELFQQMDQERAQEELRHWRSLGRKGKPPSRLMQETELKDYLLQERIQEDETEKYGRGRRDRPDVVYDDNLTEFQFARMLEGKPVKRKRSSPSSSDEEEEDEEDEEADPREAKRRKKLEKAAAAKRKPKKERKQKQKEKEKDEEDEGEEEVEMDEELKQNINEILDVIEGTKNAEGEDIGSFFVRLPSKSYYRDYYHIIKQPVSINKIRKSAYASAEEFKEEVVLMFRNAHVYNQPGSAVYEAATQLMKLFKEEYEKRFGGSDIDLSLIE